MSVREEVTLTVSTIDSGQRTKRSGPFSGKETVCDSGAKPRADTVTRCAPGERTASVKPAPVAAALARFARDATLNSPENAVMTVTTVSAWSSPSGSPRPRGSRM